MKWLDVHPYLHTSHGSGTLDATFPETVDAQEELDRLKPLIHAIGQDQ